MFFVPLQVTTYNDELQGQSGPGFAWLLFDSSVDAPVEPRSTLTANFTFTDDDTRRVCTSLTYFTTAYC